MGIIIYVCVCVWNAADVRCEMKAAASVDAVVTFWMNNLCWIHGASPASNLSAGHWCTLWEVNKMETAHLKIIYLNYE